MLFSVPKLPEIRIGFWAKNISNADPTRFAKKVTELALLDRGLTPESTNGLS